MKKHCLYRQLWHLLNAICLIFFLKLNSFAQSGIKEINNTEPSKILSEYLKIRSNNGSEYKAGRYLSKLCSDFGLYVKTFTDSDSAYNFAASLYPLDLQKPNIVFLNHLDVVSANDSVNWLYPPFSGTICDNGIYGRGAIDCKGLAIIQLLGMLPYAGIAKTNDLPYNVTMLSVSDEETDSENGAVIVTNKFLNDLNPVVVFGEGGSGISNVVASDTNKIFFGISVAEKRSLWLKLEVKSESFAHGAGASNLYANKKLLRVLIKLLDEKKYVKFNKLLLSMFSQLGELEGGLKGFVIKHINWNIFWPLVKSKFTEGEPLHLLVYNTFAITNISNPKGPSNQVAEKASATLDCRLLPEMDSARFLRKLKNTVGPKVKITVLSASPEAPPSATDKFFDAMSAALQRNFDNSVVMPVLFPATTDNNYFRRKNINTYGIFPAVFSIEDMQSVHNKNEKISAEALNKGIKVIQDFIGTALYENNDSIR